VKAVALSARIVNTAKNVPLTIKSIIENLKGQSDEAKAAVLILSDIEKLKEAAKKAKKEGAKDPYTAYVKGYGELKAPEPPKKK
jgi:hypothetical protein